LVSPHEQYAQLGSVRYAGRLLGPYRRLEAGLADMSQRA
jgi:hypothetical protein